MEQNTAAAQTAVPVKDDADDAQNSGEIDFGAILEQFEQEQTIYHAGELVEGKVVGISDRGALVDFGYKSEGVIPAEEMAAIAEDFAVGDTRGRCTAGAFLYGCQNAQGLERDRRSV